MVYRRLRLYSHLHRRVSSRFIQKQTLEEAAQEDAGWRLCLCLKQRHPTMKMKTGVLLFNLLFLMTPLVRLARIFESD